MSFVHLKSYSEYSIKRGINKVDKLSKKAKENAMGAVALTDYNAMFGSIAFYKAAKKNGLKPIVGVTQLVEQENGNVYELTLLAKNNEGYKKLIDLNSKAYLENRKEETAYLKEEDLGLLTNDIIVLSGAKQGLIGKLLLENNFAEAKLVAEQMKEAFGDDFYMELQRDGTVEEDMYMDGAVRIASELGIAPVATHPVYFENKEDFVAHEVRYCISNKETFIDMKRKKHFNKEMYFKSQQEMEELFSDIPVALENTVKIAKKCNIDIELDKPMLPEFPLPVGTNADDYFEKLAKEGLVERLREDFPNIIDRKKVEKEYQDRLQMEINTIKKMGFPGYFLIVADFITWAKNNDIPVGPGRGSGAGSLVAYSMKITDLDPLPYGLLFERFLNPDRVSMPDFDIDFCQNRRDEVFNYVKNKYGADKVCKIGTFGTLAPRAVIRDVGRALSHSYSFMDSLAKLITIKAGADTTLQQFIFGDESMGIKADEKMLERYNQELDVKKLIDIALKIEGLTKQVGVGAAGVVIAPGKLTEFTPVYTPSVDGPPQTQYDKNDSEKAGLVKFDFLGLTNLTIVKEVVDLIHKEQKENEEKDLFDIRKIDLNDIDVFKNIYGNMNTGSVFQFESVGMSRVLQKAEPTSLADIIAINALYRPGPMDIIPDWLIERKKPEEERTYPHPLLKEVLKETAGFMIYQEQVMQCAQVIAGYSLGQADILRRAMGKKNAEEMRKQREIFITGAAKNSVSAEKANELFDLIDKFSGYGFNKSHAAAYSYVSYQTAFLKYYYPREFFTATLNAFLSDTDKVSHIVKDAKKNEITVLPPNVNNSNQLFSIEGNSEIRYGLSGIKGIGDQAAHAIQVEREKNGEYIDFFDFIERVGKGHVNKKVMEALVKCGALDDFCLSRADLLMNVESGLDYVAKLRKKQTVNKSVFGDALVTDKPKRKAKAVVELLRPDVIMAQDRLTELDQLKLEKAAFGYYFASNPYESVYLDQLNGLKAITPLNEIREIHENEFREDFYSAALVEKINWWKSKKGAFVTLSDGRTTVDVRMFESTLNENKDWLKEDAFISIKLKAELSEDELLLSTKDVFSFEQTKSLLMEKIYIGTNDNQEEDVQVNKLENILKNHKAGQKDDNKLTVLLYGNDENNQKRKRLKTINDIKYSEELMNDLKSEFSEKMIKGFFRDSVERINFPKKYKDNKKKKNSFSI